MQSDLKIPRKLRRKIDEELQIEEVIQWIEQPVPRLFTNFGVVLLFCSGVFTLIFGILATCFFALSVGRSMQSLQGSGRTNFLYFGVVFSLLGGLPFDIFGLLLMSIPLGEWRAARRTAYLVTDKRAISIRTGRTTTIKSYFPDQLNDLELRERTSRMGDVFINLRQWKDKDGYQNSSGSEKVGFLGVRHPQETKKRLRQLAQRAN